MNMEVFESSMSCCVGNMSATKKAWSFPLCLSSLLNSEMKYVMEISPQCDWEIPRISWLVTIYPSSVTLFRFTQNALCFLVSTKENLNEFHCDTVVSWQQVVFQTTYIQRKIRRLCVKIRHIMLMWMFGL